MFRVLRSLRQSFIISIREQMFRLFTARIKARFDNLSSYIREQMFRLLTARIKGWLLRHIIREQMFRLFRARIEAMFDQQHFVVLENKCFVFLRGA